MNDLIQTVAVYALPVLFAITLHEAAHAYAAKYFGDNTAYMLGRMSLNPLKHIDPFGTIAIPIVLYFATGGAFLFGYAKPVPLDFGKLRKPKRDMAWVALAGPMANFVMALIWTLVIYALFIFDVSEDFFMLMAKAGVLTNLVMLAFNLFPIPPLDGGRILTSLLPPKYAYKFAQIEPYGFFIVMALVMLKVIYFWWMAPVMYLANSLLQLITYPLTFLFN
ncbi:site-2 protease family protein [Herbaspirillum sp. RTI4]|uniref:site-2 protease family protein n=1 Tax=Herbaspirillum sp. RTI4 TaxID=3048640 RepID=UPI002AB4ECA0|nr:site-2 protease family protein [Herbaspirillum sp. RTI4]MDY7578053.1 site-2 protease family protein [Herbaspirillum sp. RTI4]MEA9983183.1 site-2 protease family protein [Herbaspirillum sp. RTI4]